jgi:hypothetical protein
VILDHKVLKELKVFQGQQALLALKVPLALLDLLGLKAYKVPQDLLDLQGHWTNRSSWPIIICCYFFTKYCYIFTTESIKLIYR